MPARTRGEIVAVLDACVLLPASLRDTLLRLAETPRLYIPKWSGQIWAEVTRNLESRRKLSPEKIAHLTKQIQLHFPEAQVQGYEKFMGRMTNHPKDRHVVAAAVRANAQVIVTSNLKDFPPSSLAEWEIEAPAPGPISADSLFRAILKQLRLAFATRRQRLAGLFRVCLQHCALESRSLPS